MPRERDYVDAILEQWKQERPDLDVFPTGIIGRILRLSRLLQPPLERTFASYGLPRGGFDVMTVLRRAGSPYQLSPSELHDSLLISSGATTNRVDRLEAMGLVERVPAPIDRRAILVALTSKGKRLIDKVLTTHVENEMLLLAHLSTNKQEQLARLLRSLLVGLEEQSGEYKSIEHQ